MCSIEWYMRVHQIVVARTLGILLYVYLYIYEWSTNRPLADPFLIYYTLSPQLLYTLFAPLTRAYKKSIVILHIYIIHSHTTRGIPTICNHIRAGFMYMYVFSMYLACTKEYTTFFFLDFFLFVS